MIIKQLEVTPFVVFCYIIGSEETKEAALIDPAGEVERILSEVEALGLTVKYIINTHAHPDHIGGNADVVEKTGAEIIMHEEAAKVLTLVNEKFMAIHGVKPSPEATRTVVDGDIIEIGDVKLTVLFTPGHSPGGICLYDGGKNLFTGDTLFVAGVGRTDLPGGSMRTMMDSIKNKILTLPDDTIVWPGHNYGPTPSSTVAKERDWNPFLNF
ncbi:MAG: MBL fold metallo-hydrolase [Deltaproteobacteria bacterium]|uniref:MBL fold metallo-hydrolase n=1 Tax=Candidatus Zymogenus saltonus TaxID=2844893 RepID=A0A9D8PRD0_9DELT|nr:MBL fold metallo-hydrolase [Candidatus Zymogenus saltonus]